MMVLTSHFSDVDFWPDGCLDKEPWVGVSKTIFSRHAFSERDYPEIETAVSSLWTQSHLYFAFWCRYIDLNLFTSGDEPARGNELWTRDVVEMFLSPQSEAVSHYYEIEISPDNRSLELEIVTQDCHIRRESWISGFDHATRIDRPAKLWTVEMRVPFQSI